MARKIPLYLRSIPSFLKGMAHILDIGATFGNPLTHFYKRTDLTPKQKDAIAIAEDWKMVGGDLEIAICNYEKEHLRLSNQFLQHQ